MSNETYRQSDPWRPSPVKEIPRRQIVGTHYFSIDRASYESNQTGSFERYFIQKNNGDAVTVLAVTDDGMIPLVEQCRIASHRWTLEIPAGHANNPSERPIDVAKRKLAEEAGFGATRLTRFTHFMNTPSYSTQHIAIFFATGLTPASRQEIGPETPHSDMRMVSVDDAYEMVVNGTTMDTKTMVAILRLRNGILDHLNSWLPRSVTTVTVGHCDRHTVAT